MSLSNPLHELGQKIHDGLKVIGLLDQHTEQAMASAKIAYEKGLAGGSEASHIINWVRGQYPQLFDATLATVAPAAPAIESRLPVVPQGTDGNYPPSEESPSEVPPTPPVGDVVTPTEEPKEVVSEEGK